MSAKQAKHLLVYYFRLVARQSGVRWDSDNDSEVEQIIDEIIEACVDEVAEQETSPAETIRNNADAKMYQS